MFSNKPSPRYCFGGVKMTQNSIKMTQNEVFSTPCEGSLDPRNSYFDPPNKRVCGKKWGQKWSKNGSKTRKMTHFSLKTRNKRVCGKKWTPKPVFWSQKSFFPGDPPWKWKNPTFLYEIKEGNFRKLPESLGFWPPGGPGGSFWPPQRGP